MARVWFNEADVRKMANAIDDILIRGERLRDFLRDNLDAIIDRQNSEEYINYAKEHDLMEDEWVDYVGGTINDAEIMLEQGMGQAECIYELAEWDIKEML